ncbi:granzyme C isoform X2 [Mus caroli]|uniref:Granzyme C isoform X2 n=1 Tax=Mus caroli TaxID=10089 RepID=A0A6P7PVT1_MUSCR|nr:granzyme C isoform X2 [Mus caroli]
MPPVLILLTLLLPLRAGAEEIIGGNEISPHSRPYMAYYEFLNGGKKMFCGGFLIREKFVLTAAHCKGREMTVTLGAHNIKAKEETQQIIPVAEAIPHPDYNPGDRSNDIMLLKEDSGGPLVCKRAAAGIVSYGQTDGSAPQVFTRVLSFVSWLKKTMKHS